jgi:predicted ATPase
MLETLRFQNFKSWRDTGDVRFAKVTGFFGTNSSGKSSILQFLLMLKQTVESNDMNRVLHTGDENSYVDLGSTQDFLYNHEIPNLLKYSLGWKPLRDFYLPLTVAKINPSDTLLPGWDTYDKTLRLDSTINVQKSILWVEQCIYTFTSKSDRPNTVGLKRIIDPEHDRDYEIVADGDVSPIAVEEIRQSISPPFKNYGFSGRSTIDFNFIGNLVSSLENQLRQINYLGPLRDYPRRLYLWSGETPQNVGQRGELTTPALLAAQRESSYVEEKVAYWLKELGLIHDFRLQPIAENRREHEIRIRRTPKSAETTITDVGFGVSQILPVLVLCYYVPEGSTIILEQPEIHLHPSVQAGLADVLIDAMKTRNIQIILESHSEHLLRRLQRRIAEAQNITNGDAALYFCDMDDNGESHLMPLELDEFGNINNWPQGFFGDEMGDLVAMTEAAMQRQMAGDES